MKELLRRFSLRPRLAWELMLASFFANLMSMASPVYVIMVLNRYIGYGFDGTLVTLTFGVLIASALGFGFGEVRTRLAGAVSLNPDRELSERTLMALARARLTALQRVPAARQQEVLGHLQTVQGAFDASGISSVADAPYLALYLLAILLLSPLLAFFTLVAIALTAFFTLHSMRQGDEDNARLREEAMAQRGLLSTALAGAETVRAFLGLGFLQRAWTARMKSQAEASQTAEANKSRGKRRIEAVSVLLRVGVYAIGAMLAVAGDMSVGALIGVSILSGKAMQVSTGFLQSFLAMHKAEEAGRQLAEFLTLPLEPLSGTAMREYAGRQEFVGVGFAYAGTTNPVFENLSFRLEAGTILAVTGNNGSGKSTFCKLSAGLLDPGRGQILADGIDLRQLAPDWWRRQVLYLPQEPTFLNGTIRENILLSVVEPEAEGVNERLNEAIRAASLRRFLDVSRTGLDTDLVDGGRTLPVGIRKRVALARALMHQGRLAVFDDPTEGLDAEGMQAVYAVLNALARQGCTIVVATADANILKAATHVLDMNAKPTPALGAVRRAKQEEDA